MHITEKKHKNQPDNLSRDVITADNKSALGSKLNDSKNLMGFLTATLPAVGAVGTIFVWITANFFVGNIEIQTPNSFHSLLVTAYDTKGQSSTFHTPHFQLMPGQYHLEVTVDDKEKQHTDVLISFSHTTKVQLMSSSKQIVSVPARKKRHWWQWWRNGKTTEQTVLQ